ncbi:hypothetical protein B0H63DRAFT_560862 [Podospora didyma]|uniref:Protein kinase domain-containing protein n=1 Tax=Podospora didyma TaxID=330526 RepID=A0AAE0NGL3_9PEZI|nr:hypothetical protein B0H63DRAFT_560862 [Podospora didyma]
MSILISDHCVVSNTPSPLAPPLIPSGYPSEAFRDIDTFRMLSVVHRNGKPTPAFATWKDYEAWESERDAWEWAGEPLERDETARLLRAVVDDLSPDVVALDLSASGRVLWTSNRASIYPEQGAPATYYPSVAEYQLQASSSEPPLPVVTRAQLTVVAHLPWCVDKVVHSSSSSSNDSKLDSKLDSRLDGSKDAVFKCNPFTSSVGGDGWRELQELTGLGVIGFTMPWVPTPTLDRQWSFKLSCLRQLLTLDLADRNVFVHPDNPDEILLFDFNYAAITDDVDPARDDIKGVIALVYILVTSDPAFARAYFLPAVHENTILRGAPASLIKHPCVELDTDVSVIYQELMEWVRQRRSRNPNPSPSTNSSRPPPGPRPGPCAIRRAPQPTPPSDVVTLDDGRTVDLIGGDTSAEDRIRAGRPTLNWRRPPVWTLDPSRRILATGRYVDEQEAYDRFAPKILVPDPTRGFPQPPFVAASGSPQKLLVAGGGEGGNNIIPKRKRSDADPDSTRRKKKMAQFN